MTTTASNSINPTEVARETIRQLALRRIAPTPENYSRIYGEVAGEAVAHPVVSALERALGDVVRAGGPVPSGAHALAQALKRQKWEEIEAWCRRTLTMAASAESLAWHGLVRDLLKQWELRQDGLSQGRKREALEHVLDNSRTDPAKLYQRLTALVKGWGEIPLARTQHGTLPVLERDAADPETAGLLREMLAQTIEFAVTDRLGYTPELAGDAARLALLARESGGPRDINRLGAALKSFWLKLELRGENVDGLMRGLVTLVKLLTQNIGTLTSDEWLKGQMARAEELLREPLDVRALREAEKGFRQVAYRQAAIKGGLDEAKDALKSMVGLLIERLDDLTESAGGYQDRFAAYAGQIEAAENINALSAVLGNLLADTRGAQATMKRSRDQLREARDTARAHETRVRQLESELAEVGQLIKEDQLTTVLNRRGLEEAFAVEEARSRRAGAPLSVALLDIDNFKALNDQLGHLAGDNALKHLASILRDAIRPSDVVARLGGEEFVLLLPDTAIEEAVAVMTRVQRTLTRRFFLHQNEKVLITFSAGVALLGPGEARDAAIARADSAMYRAKRQGLNHCVYADEAGSRN